MRAWEVRRPGPIDSNPLAWSERAAPRPGPGELLVKVSVCGVCRTDLHVAEGDLRPRRPRVVPGHEVVGRVEELGESCSRFEVGDRVGIPWLRHTCGHCTFCTRSDENLCVDPLFTGWDEDGGYADYATIDHNYAYAIPETFADQQAAPLLCAGIIGYRAYRQARLPPKGTLGVYGFGGSAHIASQVALYEGARVHVMTRSRRAQELAEEIGATSVGDPAGRPPEPLDAAILFAPAGELVPVALSALDRGGTLAIAGIHLSRIPGLDYEKQLFYERKITSVTANTRQDGREFLEMAERVPIQVSTVCYGMDRADEALRDLAHGRVRGAAVLLNEA
jgi:propanol-preferring alcohol dehydrogenase